MMGVTFGFCCLSYFAKGFYRFQLQNYWCLYIFLGIALALTVVVMACGNNNVKELQPSSKIIMLVIINLSFSYVVSFCTSLYAEAYGAPLVV